jgi:hypothetical protein
VSRRIIGVAAILMSGIAGPTSVLKSQVGNRSTCLREEPSFYREKHSRQRLRLHPCTQMQRRSTQPLLRPVPSVPYVIPYFVHFLFKHRDDCYDATDLHLLVVPCCRPLERPFIMISGKNETQEVLYQSYVSLMPECAARLSTAHVSDCLRTQPP